MEIKIKEILNKELVGNDVHISDIILSYIKERCFICWYLFIDEELNKSYCDTRPHTQLYMKVCPGCIKKFGFNRCYMCKVYVDKNRCYTVGTLDNTCCRYCVMSSLSEYTGV